MNRAIIILFLVSFLYPAMGMHTRPIKVGCIGGSLLLTPYRCEKEQNDEDTTRKALTVRFMQVDSNLHLWVVTDADIKRFDLVSGLQANHWPVETEGEYIGLDVNKSLLGIQKGGGISISHVDNIGRPFSHIHNGVVVGFFPILGKQYLLSIDSTEVGRSGYKDINMFKDSILGYFRGISPAKLSQLYKDYKSLRDGNKKTNNLKIIEIDVDGQELKRGNLNTFDSEAPLLHASNSSHKQLAIFDGGSQIKIWSVEKELMMDIVDIEEHQTQEKDMFTPKRPKPNVAAMCFSEDGKFLFAMDNNNRELLVWKQDTLRYDLDQQWPALYKLKFSPYKTIDFNTATAITTYDHFLFASDEREITIWDMLQMKPVLKFTIRLSDAYEDYAVFTEGSSQEPFYITPNGLYDKNLYKNDKNPNSTLNNPHSIATLFQDAFAMDRSDLRIKLTLDSLKRIVDKRDENFRPEEAKTNPRIIIENSIDLLKKRSTEMSFVDVTFRAEAPDHAVSSIYVWVSNVPFFGRKGWHLLNPEPKVTQTFTIPLVSGENKIELRCRDSRGHESCTEWASIYSKKSGAKPNLYLIALGVDSYQKFTTQLRYAVKDGRDFIHAFSQNAAKSGGFDTIFVDTLFNEKVAIAELKNLRQRLLKSQVDDLIMILYSGHGMQDSLQRLFLGTTALDLADLASTALPFEVLENLLDSIPARQKLMFIDACQSGLRDKSELVKPAAPNHNDKPHSEGMGKESTLVPKGNRGDATPINTKTNQTSVSNDFPAMQKMFYDLNKGTGTVTIAAASGYNAAWEDFKWRNGALTYALLQGVAIGPNGNMPADLDQNGEVLVSELQRYLEIEVPDLTNGRQKPIMRTVNVANNFKIR